jgi:hypothetical protein
MNELNRLYMVKKKETSGEEIKTLKLIEMCGNKKSQHPPSVYFFN